MSLAVWPGLLLGLAAVCIAGSRVYILAWRAPVAAAPLAAALTRQIASGEIGRAYALCRALDRCWAADCAEQCLNVGVDRGRPEQAALATVVEELSVAYAQRAQSGIEVLRALGRMAFPLALGAAIVSMSGAFAAADVERVERALSTALQCMTVGVLSAVFCRASAAVVSRQGEARMREIAAVCRGLMAGVAAGACGAPTQA